MKAFIERLIEKAMGNSLIDPVPHAPYDTWSKRHKIGALIENLTDDEKEQLKNVTSEDFQGRFF